MTNARTEDIGRISVRSAEPADAERLADLALQLGYPTSAEEVESRLPRYANAEDARIFVAELDGRVVAWTSVEAVDHFYLPRYAEISGLVVDSAHRGNGIGPLLLKAVEAWAMAQGLPSVRLRTNVLRTDAHRFYEREGFARKKTQYLYEKLL